MTEQQLSVLREAIATALAGMSPEQQRNLVVGPYLEIRSEASLQVAV